MRIIGGSLRSRIISFPRHATVRPMTDRMRETLFNILGDSICGAHVLDIFSGSGSIGLEALSRGAVHVTFVDRRRENINVIEKNLTGLGLRAGGHLVCDDALAALFDLNKGGRKFDAIFLDPPYDKGLMKKLLLHLDQSDILQPLAWVVCHHSAQEELPKSLHSLLVERSKKIGQARLSFLVRKKV